MDRSAHHRRLPVVLVADQAGSDATWGSLRTSLARAGFDEIQCLDPVTAGTLALDEHVAERAEAAVRRSDGDGIHLVGHGRAGLAVHRVASGTSSLRTRTAVMVATPLRRIPPLLAPCRSRSALHRAGTRWVSYFSDRDCVVDPWSARLPSAPRGRGHAATNHLVPGCDHLSLCHDGRLIRSLLDQLIAAETPSTPAALVADPQAA